MIGNQRERIREIGIEIFQIEFKRKLNKPWHPDVAVAAVKCIDD